MTVRHYQFYLFDDVPLIVEDDKGQTHTVVTKPFWLCKGQLWNYNWCGKYVDSPMFDPFYESEEDSDDYCLLTVRWNTGKYRIHCIASTFIKVLN